MIVFSRTDLAAGNVYAGVPVIRLVLRFEDGETSVGEDMVSLWHGVVAALPAFGGRTPYILPHASTFERILSGPGTSIARLVEALALILQRSIHWPVRYSAGDDPNTAPSDQAIFESRDRLIGFAAGDLAVGLLAATTSATSDRALRRDLFKKGFDDFTAKMLKNSPTVDSLWTARAAAVRGVPWVPTPHRRMVQLGQGRFQRWIDGGDTGRTSAIAVKIARDKAMTHALLRSAGIPVPEQRGARSPEAAIEAAKEIGFPVVIKPATGNMGKSVTVDVADETEVGAAFHHATKISKHVIVEAMIRGDEYRLLVVGGRYVAACYRRPAHVMGDGRRTIQELIDHENRNPDRGSSSLLTPMKRLKADQTTRDVLARQGLTPSSVPESGQSVLLRLVSNVSAGGTAEDRTDRIHPANRIMAERAAATIGLDVCGVDFLTTDPTRPYWETAGAICEVNSRPMLALHRAVSKGRSRDVHGAIVQAMFPDPARARIPVVVILSTGASTAFALSIAEMFIGKGLCPGVWASGALRVGGADVVGEIADPPMGAEAIVRDGTVDAAVIQTTPGNIVERGLGLESIDILVLDRSVDPSTAAAKAMRAITIGAVVDSADPAVATTIARVLRLPARRARKN